MFDSCIMALQFSDYPMRKVILDFTSRLVGVCNALYKRATASDNKKCTPVQQNLRGLILKLRTFGGHHISVEYMAKAVQDCCVVFGNIRNHQCQIAIVGPNIGFV